MQGLSDLREKLGLDILRGNELMAPDGAIGDNVDYSMF